MPEATSIIATFAAVSARLRNMLRRTSGAALRRSIATKAVSSRAESASVPRVRVEAQPYSCALTMP